MDLEKNCRKFLEIKFIKFPHDIFRLDYKKIEKLEGWKLSVKNLEYSINQKISLERFIYHWGSDI